MIKVNILLAFKFDEADFISSNTLFTFISIISNIILLERDIMISLTDFKGLKRLPATNN